MKTKEIVYLKEPETYAIIGTVFYGKKEDCVQIGNFVLVKISGGLYNDENIRENAEKILKKHYPKAENIEVYKKI